MQSGALTRSFLVKPTLCTPARSRSPCTRRTCGPGASRSASRTVMAFSVLPRAKGLTFQQWASMLLLREELCYDVGHAATTQAQAWLQSQGAPRGSAAPPGPQRSACHCVQCTAADQPFSAPKQPRWGHDRELLCCLYDSWRRMEQVRRKSKAHTGSFPFQKILGSRSS